MAGLGMKIKLDNLDLTEKEKNEINRLLKEQNRRITNDLEQIWYLMDLVWDEFGCDNQNLNWEKLSKFYAHPIWLLNGLFIEQHNISMGHRKAISDWIFKQGFSNVVDFGGGLGTLAILIAEKSKNINVSIFEPYPTKFTLKRINEFENVSLVNKLSNDYDCLVSTDVLEHVPDPLFAFYKMIKSVSPGSYLILGNCFQPVTKCHLPQTFHLRYTFDIFARILGLQILGNLEGSPAMIYKKTKDVDLSWDKVRFLEKISKNLFPILIRVSFILKPIKKLKK